MGAQATPVRPCPPPWYPVGDAIPGSTQLPNALFAVPLESKQSVHLDNESAVSHRGRSIGEKRFEVAVFGIHDEQLAPWRIFPPQSNIRTDRVAARVVLKESAEKHPWGKRVVDAGTSKVGREASLRQVYPVERHARLDRQLWGNLDSASPYLDGCSLTAPKATRTNRNTSTNGSLGTEHIG